MTVNRWTGRETRLLRHALRLSVRGFAEDLGVSPRTVSKWEAGSTRSEPRPELQAALDTLLRRATAADQERFAQSYATTPGGRPPIRSAADAGDARTALGDSAAEAAAFAAWWESASAGPLTVDLLFAELRRLAASYLDSPPEPIVLAVRNLRNGIFELIRRHQSPNHARDLHVAAGYACVLLSWFSGDLGQPGAADTHARTGALFVNTSGSRELGAWVQAACSKMAFWAGDYRAAADAATAGLAVAPTTGVRVLLAAQVADAWATAGAESLAQASLDRVGAARQSVTARDQIGGLLSCTPAREANYLSGVYQCLGASDQAVATAGDALVLSRAQPVRSYATEAQVRLNLARVFLQLGDLEAAADAIRPVLALPPQRRLDTLTRRVGQLADPLSDRRFRGNDVAHNLRHQIAAFVDEPLD